MARQLSQDVGLQHANLSLDQMKRGFDRLARRLAEVEAFDPQSVSRRRDPRIEALEAGIDEALTLAFGFNTIERNRYKDAHKLDQENDFAKLGRDLNRRGSPQQDAIEARSFLIKGKARSLALLRQALSGLEEDIADRELKNAAASTASGVRVFVVHGHDEGARQSVARFLEQLGLTAIILAEQPNRGRTIIEKFVDYARDVGFAVVLFTPDDLGGAAADENQKTRARQNVVFELGYFVGALGRGRACLLRKGDVEMPSDLFGVVYSTMDSGNGWKIELARELRDAGFQFDTAKVLG